MWIPIGHDALDALRERPPHPRARAFRRVVAGHEVIEPYDHVWNATLVQWLDEIAAVVLDRPSMLTAGRSWFVVRQEIDYRAETMRGDAVLALAWVASVDRAQATLKTRFLRGDDVLLCSVSRWMLVDLATRRPLRAPPDVRDRLDPLCAGLPDRAPGAPPVAGAVASGYRRSAGDCPASPGV